MKTTFLIDPAKGIVREEYFIFVLKFTSDQYINVDKFCDNAQDILYDDIGSIGHFRIAPASKKHLTADFIEMAYPHANVSEFMPREDNELLVAFIIRETDSGCPLSEELKIIPQELKQFSDAFKFDVQQMDIRKIY